MSFPLSSCSSVRVPGRLASAAVTRSAASLRLGQDACHLWVLVIDQVVKASMRCGGAVRAVACLRGEKEFGGLLIPFNTAAYKDCRAAAALKPQRATFPSLKRPDEGLYRYLRQKQLNERGWSAGGDVRRD